MEICILGSGSRGNATYLEADGFGMLIDAGLSPTAAQSRLAASGISDAKIRAILITHTHDDHARFVTSYAKQFDLEVHTHLEAARELERSLPIKLVEPEKHHQIGPFEIHCVKVKHDRPNIALRIRAGEDTLGYSTDAGSPSDEIIRVLKGAKNVLVESNHDLKSLKSGPYSAKLRARVSGPFGHLSNAQCGRILRRLNHETKRVVLLHLSEKNNQPHLAHHAAKRALAHLPDVELRIASQNTPLRLPEIGDAQMSLF